MPAPISFAPPECPLVFQRNTRCEFLLTLQVLDPVTLAPTGAVADLTDVNLVRAVLRRARVSNLAADVEFDAEVVEPATNGTIRVKATKAKMLRVQAGDYVFGCQTEMATDGPWDGVGILVGEATVVDNLFGPVT